MSAPALGVCYYPEHWTEDMWETDAARMAEVGIRYVRIGEFAWSRLEPEPERFDFGWMLRAMDILHAQGLKVVVGTPTATPPRWMIDRHPDMLQVDADGRPRKFGSRRHYCFSHLGYREEAGRIARIVAEHVGQHPALAGWQTDNEYGCHDTVVSYSAAALDGFRRWLADKYSTIGALNDAWGTVFWSMEYRAFNEIELPAQTTTEPAPAHRLDFRRYSSDQVAVFNRVQYEALKSVRPDLPVMHNFMGRFTGFDHFAVAKHLDIATWDSYPIGFLQQSTEQDEVKEQFFRQGDPDLQAMMHDIYRAVGRGRWWVMEQQPGPVNWASYNPDPLPGMARLWAWEAFAHGAEVVSYFRWRQAPFAQEQMHAGLLRPDSEPAPAYHEAQQVTAELKTSKIEGSAHRGRVAIVYDYESEWAWDIQPHSRGFNHFDEVRAVYAPFRKRGLDVDIVPATTKDLSGYDIVAIPALFTWTDELKSAIADYEGALLVGPRTGSRTPNFAIPPSLPPDLPSNLLDVKVARVDSTAPERAVAVKGGGGVERWRERLDSRAETLIEDEEGFPVLVAQGRVHYLAAAGDRALMQRVVDRLMEEADVEPLALPAGVRCRCRGGFRIYVNYGASDATLRPSDDEAGYVIGGAAMPAAGVTVARLATAD